MPKKERDGCMVCGEPLEYSPKMHKKECRFCAKETMTSTFCQSGHYVCDTCHSLDALKIVEEYCLQSKEEDPMAIVELLMSHSSVSMHGPEHHSVVPAALVTAYLNKTQKSDPAKIKKAIARGAKVPGGYCGFYGACGAAIGVGIAVSVILEATPLSVIEWRHANRSTSKALDSIGQAGGPRCCKRNTRLAIEAGAKYISKELGVKLTISEEPSKCAYVERNQQCIKKGCRFF